MRNPSGYGSIKKLPGKRRRPYAVMVTTKYELAKRKDISFLEEYLDSDLYDKVVQQYDERCLVPLKAIQKQAVIGYYSTRQEAMIALADYNRNPFDIDKQKVTFNQVYEELKRTNPVFTAPTSKTTYTSAYKHCSSLYNMRVVDVKLSHMQKIIDGMSSLSISTQNNVITLLRAVFSYCAENDIVTKDYSVYVKTYSNKVSKKKSVFTKDEIKIMWNNLEWMHPLEKRSTINAPLVDSLIILIYTGLRINEFLGIKKEDVHLEERWIDIHGTKTKAAERAVPIHKDIIPLIKARMESSKGEFLFEQSNKNPIDYSRYKERFFRKFMSEFGMDHTIHECRHTFVSIAAASGINQILLKKMVGHATADVTVGIYTHTYIEDLLKEVDKFSI